MSLAGEKILKYVKKYGVKKTRPTPQFFNILIGNCTYAGKIPSSNIMRQPGGHIVIYFVYFAHCSCSLSTLLDWVDSLYVGRSLFAICIVPCSQFEHSGDSMHNAIFPHNVLNRTSCARDEVECRDFLFFSRYGVFRDLFNN